MTGYCHRCHRMGEHEFWPPGHDDPTDVRCRGCGWLANEERYSSPDEPAVEWPEPIDLPLWSRP